MGERGEVAMGVAEPSEAKSSRRDVTAIATSAARP